MEQHEIDRIGAHIARHATYVRPMSAPMPEYTEGVCGDGAAILADGKRMMVHEVVNALNYLAAEVTRLRKACDAAAYADWLQSPRTP